MDWKKGLAGLLIVIVLMAAVATSSSACTLGPGNGRSVGSSVIGSIVEEGCPSWSPLTICEQIPDEAEEGLMVAHLTAEDMMLIIILVGTLRG